MSNEFWKYFSDVDLGSLGAGALDGDGLSEHGKSKNSLDPNGQGVEFQMKCDSCGQAQAILVSWDELIFVAEKVPPPGNAQSPAWGYDARRGVVHPNLPCVACQRNETLLGLTPDEAQRHLQAGINAGFLSPDRVARGVQVIRAQRGGR